MVETERDEVGFAVVGHPAREQAARELAEVMDAKLFMDYEGLGEWDNHARAWQSLVDYDFGVVLQDDAQPVENARQQMAAAVKARPKDVISFYTGTGAPAKMQPRIKYASQLAEQRKISWLFAGELYWGVAVGMPSRYIPQILSFESDKVYDMRIGEWCKYKHIKVSYTYPSLVDHADGVPVAHDAPYDYTRKAHKTGNQVDPTDPRHLALW